VGPGGGEGEREMMMMMMMIMMMMMMMMEERGKSKKEKENGEYNILWEGTCRFCFSGGGETNSKKKSPLLVFS
jgi:hypothetical protein